MAIKNELVQVSDSRSNIRSGNRIRNDIANIGSDALASNLDSGGNAASKAADASAYSADTSAKIAHAATAATETAGIGADGAAAAVYAERTECPSCGGKVSAHIHLEILSKLDS